MSDISVKITSAGRKYLSMYYDDPASGKRVTRSTKTAVKRDAEKAAGKWEAELREGRYKPKSAVTWEEFRRLFQDEYLRDAPEATVKAYSTAFNALERHCKIGRLSELTAERIEYVARLWRTKDKCVPETESSYKRHIKAALHWGFETGHLSKVVKITLPKRQKGVKLMKGRPISGEEFDRMIAKVEAGLIAASLTHPTLRKCKRSPSAKAAAARQERLAEAAAAAAPSWKKFLRGLWWSGLRLAEGLSLSWDDERFITVDDSGDCPQLRIAAGQDKSGEERLLPLAVEFVELLRAVPEAQRSGPVFPLVGLTGEPVTDRVYASRVISKIGEAAGVVVDKASGKFASAHDLRRAFGVRWSTRVMPAVLQAMMRHADISTTMKFYVGQGASAMQDAINAAYSRINTFVNTSLVSAVEPHSPSSEVVARQQVAKLTPKDLNLD